MRKDDKIFEFITLLGNGSEIGNWEGTKYSTMSDCALPEYKFSQEVSDFRELFLSSYKKDNYDEIISTKIGNCKDDNIFNYDENKADEDLLLAFITYALKLSDDHEEFLYHYLKSGKIIRWLKALQVISE